MELSQQITRRSTSNLALAFILLPKEKRREMYALYAFCRQVDDIADNEDEPVLARCRSLQAWREDLKRAYDGGGAKIPVIQELNEVIRHEELRFEMFDEILKGVEMDLTIRRYETYEKLETYCYRVASAVGLLSIEIFHYQNPRSREYAVQLGKALQFTNILRDVAVDARRGRIYLPREELDRQHVREEEILKGCYSERYQAAAHAVGERACAFYRQARQTLPAEDRGSMIAAELMGSVYWSLLLKLRAQGFNVFGEGRIRLNSLHKLRLILQTWVRSGLLGQPARYGAL